MSINETTEKDWDAVRKDRYTDNRNFDIKDAECTLIKPTAVPEGNFEWPPEPDPVNAPPHYKVGEVEAIDYIAQQLGTGVKDYLLGNLHKYIHRHRFKGQPVEDLRKARWYLERLILEEVQGG